MSILDSWIIYQCIYQANYLFSLKFLQYNSKDEDFLVRHYRRSINFFTSLKSPTFIL